MNTQGDTLSEARTNLQEAVQLVLESNRAFAEESLRNKTVIREPLASISETDRPESRLISNVHGALNLPSSVGLLRP